MIYLLRESAHEDITKCNYKVGYTSRWVRKRITELQTGCACYLELVGWIHGNKKQEKAIHAQFINDKIRVGQAEWFRYNPRLLDVFI